MSINNFWVSNHLLMIPVWSERCTVLYHYTLNVLTLEGVTLIGTILVELDTTIWVYEITVCLERMLRRIISREYVEVLETGRYVRHRDGPGVIVYRLKHEIGDVQKLSHYLVRMRVLIWVVLSCALLQRKRKQIISTIRIRLVKT